MAGSRTRMTVSSLLKLEGDAREPLARLLRRTYGPRVLSEQRCRVGCFRLDFNERIFQRNYRDPVLLSVAAAPSAKAELAWKFSTAEQAGRDLVATAVNQLAAQGVEPLFFQAAATGAPLHDLTTGMVDACIEASCALLGVEEGSQVAPGPASVAGMAVGVCELGRIIDGSRVEPGDVVLGLIRQTLHAREIPTALKMIAAAGVDLEAPVMELEPRRPVGWWLAQACSVYAGAIVRVLQHYSVKQVIGAMAAVSGGLASSLAELAQGPIDLQLDRNTLSASPLENWLGRMGKLDAAAMAEKFGLGVGFVILVRPAFVESVQRQLSRLGHESRRLGVATAGHGRMRWH